MCQTANIHIHMYNHAFFWVDIYVYIYMYTIYYANQSYSIISTVDNISWMYVYIYIHIYVVHYHWEFCTIHNWSEVYIHIYSNACNAYPCIHNWLVVWTPLKNISQLGLLFPIDGKMKVIFQSPPTRLHTYLYDMIRFDLQGLHRDLWCTKIGYLSAIEIRWNYVSYR